MVELEQMERFDAPSRRRVGRRRAQRGLAVLIVSAAVFWADDVAIAEDAESAPIERPSASFHLDDASLPDTARTPGESVQGLKADGLCAEAEPTPLPSGALCSGAFSESRVPETRRYQYECAFLVPSAIGGSPTRKNVWLQPAEEAPLKQALDHEMRKRVCKKELSLSQAQREIESDWARAYRKYVLSGDVPVVVYEEHGDDTERRQTPVSLQSGDTQGKRNTPADLPQSEATSTPPIEASVSMGSGQSNAAPGQGASQATGHRATNQQGMQSNRAINPVPRAPAAPVRRQVSRSSLQRMGRPRQRPGL